MKRKIEEVPLNMTTMIDVVFQLLIFFLVTSDLQNTSVGSNIYLALAPHGAEVKGKDPSTVHLDVDARGNIFLAGTPMSVPMLNAMMVKTVGDQGDRFPVVIQADKDALHEYVKHAMDACTEAGVKRIKIAAIREKAGSSSSSAP